MLLCDQVTTLCGEIQLVIARLRHDLAVLNRDDGAHVSAPQTSYHAMRSLFCLREPGVLIDAFQVTSLAKLRLEARNLATATCDAREKLRTCISSSRPDTLFEPMDVLIPLLNVIRSPALTASATGEALGVLYRMVVDLGLLAKLGDHGQQKAEHVIGEILDAVVHCVFRQTESGDDEIAIMWALEVMEACVRHSAVRFLPEEKLEQVFVVLYKNSVASSNADMLRKLAVRKLSSIVSGLFGRLFQEGGGAEEDPWLHGKDLASRLFSFLCRRVDPHNGSWPEMEPRQVSLEIISTAIVSTISPKDGRILIDTNSEIHNAICDSLFRALLQLCQMAGRPVADLAAIVEGVDGSDMVKVASMTSLAGGDGADPKQAPGAEPSTRLPDGQDEVLQSGATEVSQTGSDESVAGRSAEPSDHAPSQGVQRPGALPSVASIDPFERIPVTFAALERHYAAVSNRRAAAAAAALAAQQAADRAAGRSSADSAPAATSLGSAARARLPLAVLSRALRVVHVLIAHPNTRRHLRMQIQAFYNAVFLRALEVKSKSADEEALRLVLETLTDLFADPTVTVDLYTNFDCSLDASNVCENLFLFLSNHSFPKQMRKLALDPLQLMSLRCIHTGVKAIASRTSRELDGQLASLPEGMAGPEELEQLKRAKMDRHRCAEEFNRKPKAGLKALVDFKVISDPPEPEEVARFLRDTPDLEKAAVGEFLGTSGELNEKVLRAFVSSFPMEGLSLLAALRMFLESFRLPGEAQMIDRILQCFADMAHGFCVDARKFPTVDCTYLLCFSIILLNTDLHNPNIRPERKMTFDGFVLNNKNYGPEVSKGQDMPMELLRSIYDEIKAREINTMSESNSLTGEVTTDRWRDLIRSKLQMRLVADSISPGLTSMQTRALLRTYDRQMFVMMHKPAFAALSVMYHAGDLNKQPKAVKIALDGILNCAEVASHFGMIRVLDRIAVDVCKFTSLMLYSHASSHASSDEDEDELGLLDSEDYDLTDTDEDDEDENDGSNGEAASVDVSDMEVTPPATPVANAGAPKTLAVRQRRVVDWDNAQDVLGGRESIERAEAQLAADEKAQTAINSVIEIAHCYGRSIRLAWPHIMYCVLRLFDFGLLPQRLLKESTDEPCISTSERLRFHRHVANTWQREASDRVSAAVDSLERTKSWVSWLSGESRTEAEALVRVLSDAQKTVQRGAAFAASSLEPLGPTNSDTKGIQAARRIGCVTLDRLASLVQDSTAFDDRTLLALVRGLVQACSGDESISPNEIDILKDVMDEDDGDTEDTHPDITISMLSPTSRNARIFGVQLLVEVAMANAKRLALLWPHVRTYLVRILRAARGPSCTVEKACVGLLRLSLFVLREGTPRLADDAAKILRSLLRNPRNIAPGITTLICDALARIFDGPFKWSPALARTILHVAMVEDLSVAREASRRIALTVAGLDSVVDAPIAELVEFFKTTFGRTVQSLGWSERSHGAPTAVAQESELVELVDAALAVHAKILEARKGDWVSALHLVLTAVNELAHFEGMAPSVQKHISNRLSETFAELPPEVHASLRSKTSQELAQIDQQQDASVPLPASSENALQQKEAEAAGSPPGEPVMASSYDPDGPISELEQAGTDFEADDASRGAMIDEIRPARSETPAQAGRAVYEQDAAAMAQTEMEAEALSAQSEVANTVAHEAAEFARLHAQPTDTEVGGGEPISREAADGGEHDDLR